MDFSFSEDQVAIRELAYQIFTDRSTDAFQLEFSRTDQAYDDSLWTTLAEQGLLGIGIPENCGGAGLGLIETCLVLEEQGRRVAPIPLFSSLILGAMPIIEFGTEAQHQKYLSPLAAGELKLTAAISEIAMPAAIQQGISATKTSNGWTLTGSLDCIQDGAVANFILVPATDTDGQSSVFIVDTQAEGVNLQAQEISLLGPWSAALSLNGLTVTAEALLGQEGNGNAIIHWLEQYANIGQCAMQTGICEEAMRRTAAYTCEREQFGVPIGSFQALAMRMADSYIDVEAIRSTFWLALWRLSEGLPAEAEIRAAKWWACDGAHRVIHTAQHLHAGIGADVEYPIHRFYLWAKQLSYSLGNGSHQLEQLGKLLAADDSVGYAAIEV
tara:strand:+ start:89 stop:1240 length:1152 start_codon:yes stop_codon:yes gene_type:complete